MNNNQHFTEADWRLFRKKIAGWQEAYMEKLIREYIDLLSEDGSASDKFWALEKRIKKDKQKTGVVVDMRRSMMIQNILQLLGEGAITLDDLDGFSHKLREAVGFIWNHGEI